jgi:hypothetical protein
MKRAIDADVLTTSQWMMVSTQQDLMVIQHSVVATNAAGDHIFLASLGDTLAKASTPRLSWILLSLGACH